MSKKRKITEDLGKDLVYVLEKIEEKPACFLRFGLGRSKNIREYFCDGILSELDFNEDDVRYITEILEYSNTDEFRDDVRERFPEMPLEDILGYALAFRPKEYWLSVLPQVTEED